jgi:GAF domain-containing protein
MLTLVASHNTPASFVELVKNTPQRASTDNLVGRMLATKSYIHSPDVREKPSYIERSEPLSIAAVEIAGVRTLLVMPLLKDDVLIGSFTLYRDKVLPFADNQIALVRNFADQAVIAIENARLLSELRESLAQQTATTDVLRVISGSPGDLKPVFESILDNATRICQAEFGTIYRYDGTLFHMEASHGEPPELLEFRKRRGAFQPPPGQPLARMLKTGAVVHSMDDAAEPVVSPAAQLGGARSHLAVPMFKEGALVGAITIYRTEVRPFSEKQIELVKSFAAQAVIAIENTRLLNELRESLQQQTATSDVLRVISSSPGELAPVFSAMLENATRICQAKFGVLSLREGNLFRVVAMHNPPPAYAELRRREPTWAPTGQMGRIAAQAISTKQAIQVPDLAEYGSDSLIREFTVATGARSLIIVPLLKDNEVIGVSAIYRQEVRPFADKQVALLTNFAAQAVIAIENTRLLSELRESLEQQTATSEVLSSIAGSRGELKPVFDIILASANRLCEANYGTMYLREEGGYRATARQGHLPTTAEQKWWRGDVFQPRPDVPFGRAVATRRPALVDDLATEPAYLDRDPWMVAGVDEAGIRSMCAVPMLQDADLVGVMAFYRREVKPFTEKQIALVENFAAQAVIAIENARLLTELRRRTEDLTQSLNELRTAQDRLVQPE